MDKNKSNASGIFYLIVLIVGVFFILSLLSAIFSFTLSFIWLIVKIIAVIFVLYLILPKTIMKMLNGIMNLFKRDDKENK